MEETRAGTEYPSAGDQDRITSAAEFKKKYSKKRFTSKTAAKAVMLSFIYECYQQAEGGVKESLYPNIREIQSRITSVEDSYRWNNYISLMEWYQVSFNSAVFMRNALQSALSEFDTITRNLIAGENLRRDITGEQPQTVTLWLSSLTIGEYSPQANGSKITSIRRNIEAALMYLNAYNSFADLVGKIVQIPEISILKVKMSQIWESIDSLDEALDVLREDVESHLAEALASGKGETRDLVLWSPEYLADTMKAFQPIEKEVEPVPEENREKAEARIIRDFSGLGMSWYAIFRAYSSDYWKKVKA